ncbi:MAG: hypothetical protein ACP5T3_03305 [Candidatus Micrarchaeia archaeon]
MLKKVAKTGVSAHARSANATRKASAEKAQKAAEAAQQEKEAFAIVNNIIANEKVSTFLTSNVGKYAIEVMKRLNKPKTDDVLATEMNMKVNEIRRLLNMLGSYGITRYDTHKDSKGWLTFEWYIDTGKLLELSTSLSKEQQETAINLPDNCNDFFICDKCYSYNKVVLPFETAFEHSFKCPDCGKPLKRLSKQEVKDLLAIKEKNI